MQGIPGVVVKVIDCSFLLVQAVGLYNTLIPGGPPVAKALH